VKVDRGSLTSQVVWHCDLYHQLDNRETVREMTAERPVLFVRDSSQEQVAIGYQVNEGRILCVA